MPADQIAVSTHLTEREVSTMLAIPLATLRSWRFRREVLPFTKIGRLVRYRAADIEKFLAGNTIKVT